MNKQPVARDKTKIPSRTNLTHHLSSFIGRKKELGQVHQYIAQTRLLTLIGVGGCGKTRLAQQIATELLSSHVFEASVGCVDLARIHDPGLVSQAVAEALGVRESFDQPTIELLIDYLADRKLLLVLDNCEHLRDACAQLVGTLLLGTTQ